MVTAQLDRALLPVAFLLGTWQGEGAGEYPTIQPFGYAEEIRFWHLGKPFLLYTQRTQSLDDGRPLHSEMGYLRMTPEGAEFVVAQGIGVAEVEVGMVSGTRIDLETKEVALTPTAKPITAVARSFWLDGDRLHYTLRMALGGRPLIHHLAASFRRAGD
jgi:hypothetical protein